MSGDSNAANAANDKAKDPEKPGKKQDHTASGDHLHVAELPGGAAAARRLRDLVHSVPGAVAERAAVASGTEVINGKTEAPKPFHLFFTPDGKQVARVEIQDPSGTERNLLSADGDIFHGAGPAGKPAVARLTFAEKNGDATARLDYLPIDPRHYGALTRLEAAVGGQPGTKFDLQKVMSVLQHTELSGSGALDQELKTLYGTSLSDRVRQATEKRQINPADGDAVVSMLQEKQATVVQAPSTKQIVQPPHPASQAKDPVADKTQPVKTPGSPVETQTGTPEKPAAPHTSPPPDVTQSATDAQALTAFMGRPVAPAPGESSPAPAAGAANWQAMLKLVEGKSAGELAAMDAAFKKQNNGVGMEQAAEQAAKQKPSAENDVNLAKFKKLLHTVDGDQHDASVAFGDLQVHMAELEKGVGPNHDNAVHAIIRILSTANAQTIGWMDEMCKKQMNGMSLHDYLLGNQTHPSALGDGGNAAAQYFLSGNDKLDKDKFVDVASQAVRAGDTDLFGMLMENVNQQWRDYFYKDKGGEQLIHDNTWWVGRRRQDFTDLATLGKLGADTQVTRDDGWVWDASNSSVDGTLGAMSTDERAKYLIGKHLVDPTFQISKENQQLLDTWQKQDQQQGTHVLDTAKAYYKNMYSHLQEIASPSRLNPLNLLAGNSGPNPIVLARFESIIAGGADSFPASLTKEWGYFNFNGSAQDYINDINNMTQKQWDDARANPQRRQELLRMLHALGDYSIRISPHVDQIMAAYDRKVEADKPNATWKDAQNIGSATAVEKIQNAGAMSWWHRVFSPSQDTTAAGRYWFGSDPVKAVDAVREEIQNDGGFDKFKQKLAADPSFAEQLKQASINAIGEDQYHRLIEPLLQTGYVPFDEYQKVVSSKEDFYKGLACASPQDKARYANNTDGYRDKTDAQVDSQLTGSTVNWLINKAEQLNLKWNPLIAPVARLAAWASGTSLDNLPILPIVSETPLKPAEKAIAMAMADPKITEYRNADKLRAAIVGYGGSSDILQIWQSVSGDKMDEVLREYADTYHRSAIADQHTKFDWFLGRSTGQQVDDTMSGRLDEYDKFVRASDAADISNSGVLSGVSHALNGTTGDALVEAQNQYAARIAELKRQNKELKGDELAAALNTLTQATQDHDQAKDAVKSNAEMAAAMAATMFVPWNGLSEAFLASQLGRMVVLGGNFVLTGAAGTAVDYALSGPNDDTHRDAMFNTFISNGLMAIPFASEVAPGFGAKAVLRAVWSDAASVERRIAATEATAVAFKADCQAAVNQEMMPVLVRAAQGHGKIPEREIERAYLAADVFGLAGRPMSEQQKAVLKELIAGATAKVNNPAVLATMRTVAHVGSGFLGGGALGSVSATENIDPSQSITQIAANWGDAIYQNAIGGAGIALVMGHGGAGVKFLYHQVTAVRPNEHGERRTVYGGAFTDVKGSEVHNAGALHDPTVVIAGRKVALADHPEATPDARTTAKTQATAKGQAILIDSRSFKGTEIPGLRPDHAVIGRARDADGSTYTYIEVRKGGEGRSWIRRSGTNTWAEIPPVKPGDPPVRINPGDLVRLGDRHKGLTIMADAKPGAVAPDVVSNLTSADLAVSRALTAIDAQFDPVAAQSKAQTAEVQNAVKDTLAPTRALIADARETFKDWSRASNDPQELARRRLAYEAFWRRHTQELQDNGVQVQFEGSGDTTFDGRVLQIAEPDLSKPVSISDPDDLLRVLNPAARYVVGTTSLDALLLDSQFNAQRRAQREQATKRVQLLQRLRALATGTDPHYTVDKLLAAHGDALNFLYKEGDVSDASKDALDKALTKAATDDAQRRETTLRFLLGIPGDQPLPYDAQRFLELLNGKGLPLQPGDLRTFGLQGADKDFVYGQAEFTKADAGTALSHLIDERIPQINLELGASETAYVQSQAVAFNGLFDAQLDSEVRKAAEDKPPQATATDYGQMAAPERRVLEDNQGQPILEADQGHPANFSLADKDYHLADGEKLVLSGRDVGLDSTAPYAVLSRDGDKLSITYVGDETSSRDQGQADPQPIKIVKGESVVLQPGDTITLGNGLPLEVTDGTPVLPKLPADMTALERDFYTRMRGSDPDSVRLNNEQIGLVDKLRQETNSWTYLPVEARAARLEALLKDSGFDVRVSVFDRPDSSADLYYDRKYGVLNISKKEMDDREVGQLIRSVSAALFAEGRPAPASKFSAVGARNRLDDYLEKRNALDQARSGMTDQLADLATQQKELATLTDQQQRTALSQELDKNVASIKERAAQVTRLSWLLTPDLVDMRRSLIGDRVDSILSARPPLGDAFYRFGSQGEFDDRSALLARAGGRPDIVQPGDAVVVRDTNVGVQTAWPDERATFLKRLLGPGTPPEEFALLRTNSKWLQSDPVLAKLRAERESDPKRGSDTEDALKQNRFVYRRVAYVYDRASGRVYRYNEDEADPAKKYVLQQGLKSASLKQVSLIESRRSGDPDNTTSASSTVKTGTNTQAKSNAPNKGAPAKRRTSAASRKASAASGLFKFDTTSRTAPADIVTITRSADGRPSPSRFLQSTVEDTLDRLQPAVRNLLKEARVSIRLARAPRDAAPDPEDRAILRQQARGHRSGITNEHTNFFDPVKREALITEFVRAENLFGGKFRLRDSGGAERRGGVSYWSKRLVRALTLGRLGRFMGAFDHDRASDIAATVVHEAGHGVDLALSGFSSRPEFVAGYERALARLKEAQARGETLTQLEKYVLQNDAWQENGSAGREEAFAILFAVLNHDAPLSTKPEYEQFLKNFAEPAEVMKSELAPLLNSEQREETFVAGSAVRIKTWRQRLSLRALLGRQPRDAVGKPARDLAPERSPEAVAPDTRLDESTEAQSNDTLTPAAPDAQRQSLENALKFGKLHILWRERGGEDRRIEHGYVEDNGTIRHVVIRMLGERFADDRMRSEEAFYRTQTDPHFPFEHYVPVTVSRNLEASDVIFHGPLAPGRKFDGAPCIIQERVGKALLQRAQVWSRAKLPLEERVKLWRSNRQPYADRNAAVGSYLESDSAFREQLEQAAVVASIFNGDLSAANLAVDVRGTTTRVSPIDGEQFEDHVKGIPNVPELEVLRGLKLSQATREKVDKFLQVYDTDEGRRRIGEYGYSPEHVQDAIDRALWIKTTGRLPGMRDVKEFYDLQFLKDEDLRETLDRAALRKGLQKLLLEQPPAIAKRYFDLVAEKMAFKFDQSDISACVAELVSAGRAEEAQQFIEKANTALKAALQPHRYEIEQSDEALRDGAVAMGSTERPVGGRTAQPPEPTELALQQRSSPRDSDFESDARSRIRQSAEAASREGRAYLPTNEEMERAYGLHMYDGPSEAVDPAAAKVGLVVSGLDPAADRANIEEEAHRLAKDLNTVVTLIPREGRALIILSAGKASESYYEALKGQRARQGLPASYLLAKPYEESYHTAADTPGFVGTREKPLSLDSVEAPITVEPRAELPAGTIAKTVVENGQTLTRLFSGDRSAEGITLDDGTVIPNGAVATVSGGQQFAPTDHILVSVVGTDVIDGRQYHRYLARPVEDDYYKKHYTEIETKDKKERGTRAGTKPDSVEFIPGPFGADLSMPGTWGGIKATGTRATIVRYDPADTHGPADIAMLGPEIVASQYRVPVSEKSDRFLAEITAEHAYLQAAESSQNSFERQLRQDALVAYGLLSESGWLSRPAIDMTFNQFKATDAYNKLSSSVTRLRGGSDPQLVEEVAHRAFEMYQKGLPLYVESQEALRANPDVQVSIRQQMDLARRALHEAIQPITEESLFKTRKATKRESVSKARKTTRRDNVSKAQRAINDTLDYLRSHPGAMWGDVLAQSVLNFKSLTRRQWAAIEQMVQSELHNIEQQLQREESLAIRAASENFKAPGLLNLKYALHKLDEARTAAAATSSNGQPAVDVMQAASNALHRALDELTMNSDNLHEPGEPKSVGDRQAVTDTVVQVERAQQQAEENNAWFQKQKDELRVIEFATRDGSRVEAAIVGKTPPGRKFDFVNGSSELQEGDSIINVGDGYYMAMDRATAEKILTPTTFDGAIALQRILAPDLAPKESFTHQNIEITSRGLDKDLVTHVLKSDKFKTWLAKLIDGNGTPKDQKIQLKGVHIHDVTVRTDGTIGDMCIEANATDETGKLNLPGLIVLTDPIETASVFLQGPDGQLEMLIDNRMELAIGGTLQQALDRDTLADVLSVIEKDTGIKVTTDGRRYSLGTINQSPGGTTAAADLVGLTLKFDTTLHLEEFKTLLRAKLMELNAGLQLVEARSVADAGADGVAAALAQRLIGRLSDPPFADARDGDNAEAPLTVRSTPKPALEGAPPVPSEPSPMASMSYGGIDVAYRADRLSADQVGRAVKSRAFQTWWNDAAASGITVNKIEWLTIKDFGKNFGLGRLRVDATDAAGRHMEKDIFMRGPTGAAALFLRDENGAVHMVEVGQRRMVGWTTETPAGVNDGEKLMELITREIKEETGFDLANYKHRIVQLGDIYPWNDSTEKMSLAGCIIDTPIPESVIKKLEEVDHGEENEGERTKVSRANPFKEAANSDDLKTAVVADRFLKYLQAQAGQRIGNKEDISQGTQSSRHGELMPLAEVNPFSPDVVEHGRGIVAPSSALGVQAAGLYREGRYDEAASVLERLLESHKQEQELSLADLAQAKVLLGGIYALQSRFSDAEPMLSQAMLMLLGRPEFQGAMSAAIDGYQVVLDGCRQLLAQSSGEEAIRLSAMLGELERRLEYFETARLQAGLDTATRYDDFESQLSASDLAELRRIRADVGEFGREPWAVLTQLMRDVDVVGIGEGHAAGDPQRNNADRLIESLKDGGATHLVIEASPTLQSAVDRYASGAIDENELPPELRKDNYAAVLKAARDAGLTIVASDPYDSSDKDSEKVRDQQMASAIANIVNEPGKQNKVIFWVGRWHLADLSKLTDVSTFEPRAIDILRRQDINVATVDGADGIAGLTVLDMAARDLDRPLLVSTTAASALGAFEDAASWDHKLFYPPTSGDRGGDPFTPPGDLLNGRQASESEQADRVRRALGEREVGLAQMDQLRRELSPPPKVHPKLDLNAPETPFERLIVRMQQSSVSDEFYQRSANVVAKLHPAVRKLLDDYRGQHGQGFKLVVSRAPVDVVAEGDLHKRPRGWSSDSTMEHPGAYFDPETGKAVLSEFHKAPPRGGKIYMVDLNGRYHFAADGGVEAGDATALIDEAIDSGSNAADQPAIRQFMQYYDHVKLENVEDTARHEIGHAFNGAMGDYAQSAEFQAAYEHDIAMLEKAIKEGIVPESIKNNIRYFLQQGNAGADELVAELFAILHGGGCTAADGADRALLSVFGESSKLMLTHFGAVFDEQAIQQARVHIGDVAHRLYDNAFEMAMSAARTQGDVDSMIDLYNEYLSQSAAYLAHGRRMDASSFEMHELSNRFARAIELMRQNKRSSEATRTMDRWFELTGSRHELDRRASGVSGMVRRFLVSEPARAGSAADAAGVQALDTPIMAGRGNFWRFARDAEIQRSMQTGNRDFVVASGDATELIARLKSDENAGGHLIVQEALAEGTLGPKRKLWVQHLKKGGTVAKEAEHADLVAMCEPDAIMNPVVRNKHVLDGAGDVFLRRLEQNRDGMDVIRISSDDHAGNGRGDDVARLRSSDGQAPPSELVGEYGKDRWISSLFSGVKQLFARSGSPGRSFDGAASMQTLQVREKPNRPSRPFQLARGVDEALVGNLHFIRSDAVVEERSTGTKLAQPARMSRRLTGGAALHFPDSHVRAEYSRSGEMTAAQIGHHLLERQRDGQIHLLELGLDGRRRTLRTISGDMTLSARNGVPEIIVRAPGHPEALVLSHESGDDHIDVIVNGVRLRRGIHDWIAADTGSEKYSFDSRINRWIELNQGREMPPGFRVVHEAGSADVSMMVEDLDPAASAKHQSDVTAALKFYERLRKEKIEPGDRRDAITVREANALVSMSREVSEHEANAGRVTSIQLDEMAEMLSSRGDVSAAAVEYIVKHGKDLKLDAASFGSIISDVKRALQYKQTVLTWQRNPDLAKTFEPQIERVWIRHESLKTAPEDSINLAEVKMAILLSKYLPETVGDMRQALRQARGIKAEFMLRRALEDAEKDKFGSERARLTRDFERAAGYERAIDISTNGDPRRANYPIFYPLTSGELLALTVLRDTDPDLARAYAKRLGEHGPAARWIIDAALQEIPAHRPERLRRNPLEYDLNVDASLFLGSSAVGDIGDAYGLIEAWLAGDRQSVRAQRANVELSYQDGRVLTQLRVNGPPEAFEAWQEILRLHGTAGEYLAGWEENYLDNFYRERFLARLSEKASSYEEDKAWAEKMEELASQGLPLLPFDGEAARAMYMLAALDPQRAARLAQLFAGRHEDYFKANMIAHHRDRVLSSRGDSYMQQEAPKFAEAMKTLEPVRQQGAVDSVAFGQPVDQLSPKEAQALSVLYRQPLNKDVVEDVAAKLSQRGTNAGWLVDMLRVHETNAGPGKPLNGDDIRVMENARSFTKDNINLKAEQRWRLPDKGSTMSGGPEFEDARKAVQAALELSRKLGPVTREHAQAVAAIKKLLDAEASSGTVRNDLDIIKLIGAEPRIAALADSAVIGIYDRLAQSREASAKVRLQAMTTEELAVAGEAWHIDPALPEELAIETGARSEIDKIATAVAWARSGAKADRQGKLDRSARQRFDTEYARAKQLDKRELVISLVNPAALKPAIEAALPDVESKLPLLLALKQTPEPYRVIKILMALAPGEYDRALAKFGGAAIRPESFAPIGALRLVSTFGKKWPEWLTSRSADTVHDATFWLPTRVTMSQELRATLRGNNGSPLSESGVEEWEEQSRVNLATFLTRYSDKPVKDLQMATRRWGELEAQLQQKSFEDIIKHLRLTGYPKATNQKFALAAGEHGVSVEKYYSYEPRLIASLKVPPAFDTTNVFGAEGKVAPDQLAKYKGLTGRFVPRDEAQTIYFGHKVNCCQVEGGIASAAAWHSQESKVGGLFVVENEKGEWIAGSWVYHHGKDKPAVFDNCEALTLGTRNAEVLNIYQQAAKELLKNHSIVLIGTSHSDLALPGLSDAGDKFAPLPADYLALGHTYTDATKQKILDERGRQQAPIQHLDTTNDEAQASSAPAPAAVQEPTVLSVRGARQSDLAAMAEIAQQHYPEEWRNLQAETQTEGVVLEDGQGRIQGYVAFEPADKDADWYISDIAVRKGTGMRGSVKLMHELLAIMKQRGGIWSADARESTSKKLLDYAASRGLIEIVSQEPGEAMHGEAMTYMRFNVKEPAAGAAVEGAPAEAETARRSVSRSEFFEAARNTEILRAPRENTREFQVVQGNIKRIIDQLRKDEHSDAAFMVHVQEVNEQGEPGKTQKMLILHGSKQLADQAASADIIAMCDPQSTDDPDGLLANRAVFGSGKVILQLLKPQFKGQRATFRLVREGADLSGDPRIVQSETSLGHRVRPAEAVARKVYADTEGALAERSRLRHIAQVLRNTGNRIARYFGESDETPTTLRMAESQALAEAADQVRSVLEQLNQLIAERGTEQTMRGQDIETILEATRDALAQLVDRVLEPTATVPLLPAYDGPTGTHVLPDNFAMTGSAQSLRTSYLQPCAALVVVDKSAQYLAHVSRLSRVNDLRDSLKWMDLNNASIYVLKGRDPSTVEQVGTILGALADKPDALRRIKFLQQPQRGEVGLIVRDGRMYAEPPDRNAFFWPSGGTNLSAEQVHLHQLEHLRTFPSELSAGLARMHSPSLAMDDIILRLRTAEVLLDSQMKKPANRDKRIDDIGSQFRSQLSTTIQRLSDLRARLQEQKEIGNSVSRDSKDAASLSHTESTSPPLVVFTLPDIHSLAMDANGNFAILDHLGFVTAMKTGTGHIIVPEDGKRVISPDRQGIAHTYEMRGRLRIATDPRDGGRFVVYADDAAEAKLVKDLLIGNPESFMELSKPGGELAVPPELAKAEELAATQMSDLLKARGYAPIV